MYITMNQNKRPQGSANPEKRSAPVLCTRALTQKALCARVYEAERHDIFIYIYIYLYYRYVRSEIQKWCTCRYLGTISVRTYRYFHLIHFCDVQQFS